MPDIKSKRGAEKLLSVWWIFVLSVVGVGVVIAVLMFYSADVDTRSFEAEILYEKVVDCVVQDGFLINGILDNNFDILKACKFSEDIINNEGIFYIDVGIFDESGKSLREDGKNIEKGDKSFLKDCEFQEGGVKAAHYPKCFKRNMLVLYTANGEIKKGRLEILTASNQQGRKVSI